MKSNQETKFKNTFEEEVYEGLTAFPKYLSSKYFYDKKDIQAVVVNRFFKMQQLPND